MNAHARSSAAAALIAVSVLLAGCGGQPHNAAPSQQTVSAAFRGSPAPLAALHSQANQLLSGGTSAFDARLSGLRGHYPVVVNKWASWCDPCQSEFPVFQKAAVAFGKQVAFVGVDGKDHNAAAASFLKQFPVTYPSYVDPNESIARSIGASTYYPQTVFYDRQGKSQFVHAGPYLSVGALEKDIRFYALSGR
ncbi:MAG TPA: TlpA disulfide reductase family protein [Solirubrobacteraceae bacterium]|nr:TlpA disulfide reductase family protein [Solirubrobacteraceae bacterium]